MLYELHGNYRYVCEKREKNLNITLKILIIKSQEKKAKEEETKRPTKATEHNQQNGNPGHYRCCPVAKSRLTLCNPMDCRMSGIPLLHSLLEFAQIHVH